MFTEDFNLAQRLATEVCPRCNTVGLAVPDAETYANTPEADHHVEVMTICPSTSTRKFRNIVTSKFYICILSSKFPLDGSPKGVSSLLPSLDF